MITQIRSSLKGNGFKIVLLLTLFSMVATFIPNLFKKGGEGHYASIATVNGKHIELIAFERRMYQETERLNMFRQQLGPQADAILRSLGFADPKTTAINALIQETLLNELAKKLNIHVSPEFISQKLNDPSYIAEELSDVVPYYVVDQQGINVPMINRYLAQQRLSMQDFENKIEEKIKRNTVLEILGASVYVPQQQIKNYFMQNYLGRDYTVMTLPFDAYLKKVKATPVTENNFIEYFEKEHKKYWTPEKRNGSLWEFSPKDYGITVSKQDSELYYNTHKSQFIEAPLQVQVRRILFNVDQNDKKAVEEVYQKALNMKKQLAAAPHDFERFAREYSDDKTSTVKGGLLEFFKKGDKDPEFERAAFRLQNDGDISDIIPTKDGFEIIQRVARKSAVYKPLTQVEDSIKEIIFNKKFKTQFTDDVSKLLSKSSKENLSKAIEEFAKNKKAKLQPIENMINDGSPLAAKIFKLKQGDWTSLIADGNGVLATVSSLEKPRKPEFSTVKKQVENDLYKHNALALIQKDLDVLKEQPTSTIKEKYPATQITKTGMITKDDKEKLNSFEKQGIPVSVFDSLDHIGANTTLIHENNGYLIKVEQVQEFDKKLFESNKNIIENLLYDEQKQMAQKGFIASLYRNATINLTKSMLNIKDENSL